MGNLSVSMEKKLLKLFNKQVSNDLTYKDLKRMKIDDFLFLRKIEEGNCGILYLTYYKNKRYVIKIIPIEKTENTGYVHSLDLNHSNLVKIHNLFFDDFSNERCMVIMMEYIVGDDLQKYLSNNTLNSIDVLPIIKQIIKGLSYLHDKELVHRDIKLENIMISEGNIKLIDFDFLVPTNMINKSHICGTCEYISPEMISGQRYDTKTDVWSLGVLMYILFTDTYPFYNRDRQNTLSSIVNDDIDFNRVPIKYRNLLKNVLNKDPKERFNLKQIEQIINEI